MFPSMQVYMCAMWLSQDDSKEAEVANKPSEAETSDDEAASSRMLDESSASELFNSSARQKMDLLSESLPNSPASYSQSVLFVSCLLTCFSIISSRCWSRNHSRQLSEMTVLARFLLPCYPSLLSFLACPFAPVFLFPFPCSYSHP